MIQEEFWYTRLAETSGLQPESSELLWSALSTQIEQRLLAGSSLYLPGLGAWELAEHREFVAQTQDGKLWLIPPRLTLRLVGEDERSARSVSLRLLADHLAQQTQLAPTAVLSWLEQVGMLTRELLASGAVVSWPRLGTWTPLLEDGRQLLGYDFLPQEAFVGQLNKPFSMFAPVELSPESVTGELRQEQFASLEAIYPIETQRILFAPQRPAPATEELPASSSSPSEEEAIPVATPAEEIPAEPQPTPEEEIPLPPAPTEEVAPEALPTEKSPLPTPEPEEALPAASEPAPAASPSEEQPQGLFWGILAGGIVLAVGLLYLLLTWTASPRPKESATPSPAPPAAPVTQVVSTDSLPSQDSTRLAPRDTLPSPEQAPAPASRPAPQHAPSADQTEQVRLHPGDRLSRLALKKYGHKAFWVYIYEENRAKIKDPDNIPVGVVITLPAASKYRIDAQDTNSISKALLLQRQLQQ